jgi:hypothetical protein
MIGRAASVAGWEAVDARLADGSGHFWSDWERIDGRVRERVDRVPRADGVAGSVQRRMTGPDG